MLLQNDDRLAALIKERGRQPDRETSLWACLSRCMNYKDGSPLPQQTVGANAGIFFAAGYETTAHAITWALFELAADTSMQVCSSGKHCKITQWPANHWVSSKQQTLSESSLSCACHILSWPLIPSAYQPWPDSAVSHWLFDIADLKNFVVLLMLSLQWLCLSWCDIYISVLPEALFVAVL